jgi:hypothetical protein
MADRTMVCFPQSVGACSGVSAVAIGVRHVWVYRHDGRKGERLLRSAFTAQELESGNALSFRAAALMAASLRLPVITEGTL